MESSRDSERCKACNRPFKSHYRVEHECWEDMCHGCIQASESYSDDDFLEEITELLGIKE